MVKKCINFFAGNIFYWLVEGLRRAGVIIPVQQRRRGSKSHTRPPPPFSLSPGLRWSGPLLAMGRAKTPIIWQWPRGLDWRKMRNGTESGAKLWQSALVQGDEMPIS